MTKFEDIPFLLKLGQVVDFNEYDYSPEDLIRSGTIKIKIIPVKVPMPKSPMAYFDVRLSYVLDEDVKFVYNKRTYKKEQIILTTTQDIRPDEQRNRKQEDL